MKIGSFVECIDDRFSAEQLKKISRIPKKGDYYTVRDIVEYPEYSRVGIRLEEISNQPIFSKMFCNPSLNLSISLVTFDSPKYIQNSLYASFNCS